MGLLEVMRGYFDGEKTTGIAFAIYGAVLLAVTFYLWRTQQGGFMWGIVVPLGIVGLGALVGGSVLAVKTGPQVDALASLFADDPVAFVAQELPRMQKVNANWPRLKLVWTIVIGLSLVVIWTVHKEWATGLALALLVAATSLMVLDVFAERRAKVYTAAIEVLVQPSASGVRLGGDAPR
jgi:hypothetical protein